MQQYKMNRSNVLLDVHVQCSNGLTYIIKYTFNNATTAEILLNIHFKKNGLTNIPHQIRFCQLK